MVSRAHTPSGQVDVTLQWRTVMKGDESLPPRNALNVLVTSHVLSQKPGIWGEKGGG